MEIEKDYSSYGREDVLAKYKGRISPTGSEAVVVEKLDIPNRDGFEAKLKSAAETAHKAIGDKAFDSEGGESKPGGNNKEWKIFSSYETLDPSVPISVIFEKKFWRDNLTGEVDYHYSFMLLKCLDRPVDVYDPSLQIGNVALKELGDEFDMWHRIVVSKFREQGFGKSLLRTTSAFAQAAANDSQKNKEIVCEVNQFDTIFWMIDGDFLPATPKDKEKLGKFLEGDENYAIGEGSYIFPVDVPEAERVNLGTGAEKMRRVERCLKIKFKKVLKQNADKDVDKVGDEVREKLKSVR